MEDEYLGPNASPLPIRRKSRKSTPSIAIIQHKNIETFCNPCFDVSTLGSALEQSVQTLNRITSYNYDTGAPLTNQEMKRSVDSIGDSVVSQLDSDVTKLDEEDDRNVWSKLSSKYDNFLKQVLQRTMGENPAANTDIKHGQLCAPDDEEAFGPTTISCMVGPFAGEPEILISCDKEISISGMYMRTVVKQVTEYINEAYLFYADKKRVGGLNCGVVYAHGSIKMMDEQGHSITNAIFPTYTNDLSICNSVKMKDARTDVDENTFHQLGFGGFVTNRMPIHHACTSKKDALDSMHPVVNLVVVGHTPQPTGLPTVLKEQTNFTSDQKVFLCVDTQFKNRNDNTSATVVFNDGSFVTKGKWLGIIEYEIKSHDRMVGTRVHMPSSVSMPHNDGTTPYFRVIGKVTKSPGDEVNGMYICVNFPNSYRDGGIYSGVVTVAFVQELEHEINPFTVMRNYKLHKVVNSSILDAIFKSSFSPAIPDTLLYEDCLVKLVSDHDYCPMTNSMAYKYDFPESVGESTHESMYSNIHSIVCGDIEGSIDYLYGFLKHVCKIIDIEITEEEEEEMVACVNMDMVGDESFSQSGFHDKAVSSKQRMIFAMSECILSKMTKHNVDFPGFVCIGDCIGNPLVHKDGSGMLDIFLCILWANTFCKIKLVGNRELNKLRLFSEIPNALKDKNEWGMVELNFTQSNPHLAEERSRKDKAILASLCYPAILKDNKYWMSKHPGLASHPPIYPFLEETNPWPGRTLHQVWKKDIDKYDREEKEELVIFANLVKKAKGEFVEEEEKEEEEEEEEEEEKEEEKEGDKQKQATAMDLV